MAHHEPFKHLGPLPWEDVVSSYNSGSGSGTDDNALGKDTGKDSTKAHVKTNGKGPNKADPPPLTNILTTTFSNAQILIDSIPGCSTDPSTAEDKPITNNKKSSGRARSHTDSAVSPPPIPPATSLSGKRDEHPPAKETEKLRTEWKEVRGPSGPKDNPLGIKVFKLAAKDGKGAWFARRSVHFGEVGFEKWRLGLRREFAETSRVRSGEEVKSVRGLGAEKKVGGVTVEGAGGCEAFLVSVRFPGPTTPRDFVTVILSPEDPEGEETRPRQFMLVSRPCEHPECPTRRGFIRGTYESVEVIREVPVPKSLRRTRSSIDMSRDGDGNLEKKATLRVAGSPTRMVSFAGSSPAGTKASEAEEIETEMAIEWLMVTRSDPGGSVPRFMVEKGTPGGIISDAGRFLNWLESKTLKELVAAEDAGIGSLDEAGQVNGDDETSPLPRPGEEVEIHDHAVDHEEEKDVPAPSGFYGMIASALEAAGSVVMNHTPSLPGSALASSVEDGNESDTSELDYASAEEGDYDNDSLAASAISDVKDNTSLPDLEPSIHSTISSSSQATPAASISRSSTKADRQHDKELHRLQERHRRAHDKMIKNQEKLAAKRGKSANHNEGIDAQEAAVAKLHEKHEREMAKHEEKYQRDLKRLADKREAERRKAEERERKARDREARQNLQMELEKARAERDVAVREMEILREQVGALQAQNTMLVARLGKEGSGDKRASEHCIC